MRASLSISSHVAMSCAERGDSACSVVAGPQDPSDPAEAAARDTGWLLTSGMKDMVHESLFDARAPANCAHARAAVTRTRRWGLATCSGFNSTTAELFRGKQAELFRGRF